MKDLFWKIFAVVALLVFLVSTYIFASSSRYAVQNKYFILDRQTGKTYTVKSKYYKNLNSHPNERIEVESYLRRLSPETSWGW